MRTRSGERQSTRLIEGDSASMRSGAATLFKGMIRGSAVAVAVSAASVSGSATTAYASEAPPTSLPQPSQTGAAQKMITCAAVIPQDGKVTIAMPNNSPFTLIVTTGSNLVSGKTSQFEIVFNNGNAMTAYFNGVKEAVTKKEGTEFNIYFSSLALFYVGIYSSAFTNRHIEEISKTPLTSLLLEGGTKYRWPDKGADTFKTCIAVHIPFMTSTNVEIEPATVSIPTKSK